MDNFNVGNNNSVNRYGQHFIKPDDINHIVNLNPTQAFKEASRQERSLNLSASSNFNNKPNITSPSKIKKGGLKKGGLGDDIKALLFDFLVDFFVSDPNKQKVVASTQDHLDIYDIKDDLVILKNGDAALVIETTAVNFQLLSNYEQELKINAFRDLINSLSYEIQVVVHTEPVDMRNYIRYLEKNYLLITSPLLKKQMRSYINFIKQLVVQNNILQKRFFLIIPYRSGLFLSQQINPFQKFIDFIFGKKRIFEIKNLDSLIEKAKINLYPKRDSMLKYLANIGLGARQLNNKELISLFYSYYNPVSNFDD